MAERARSSAARLRLVVLLAVSFVSTGLVFGHGADEAPPPAAAGGDDVAPAAPSEEQLEAIRRRWEAKSAAEQALLLERFRQWRSMDAEQRTLLLERLERYQAFETRLREAPPPALSEEIGGVDPERERSRWRERVERHFREQGERVRAKLPADFCKRLEEAPPETRPEMVRQFRLQQIHDKGRILLDYLAAELGLREEDVRAIERQPLDDRVAILRTLRRRHLEKVTREGQPPPGFTRERWERWGALGDREFFDRLLQGDVPAWRRGLGPPARPPAPGDDR